MGWDIYMRWKGQTMQERELQYCGGSERFGHVGYLRKPMFPFPSFDGMFDEPGGIVDTKILRSAIEQAYTMDAYALDSYRAFVDLAERKERETGEPVRVVVY